MPCRRQCSRIACLRSRRSSVHPVGLFGELTSSIRVSGVSAASSRSRSSRQPPAPNSSGTRTTSAPRIFGISVKFGHSGVTHTTRSPGPTSASTVSISADMPGCGHCDVAGRDRSMQPRHVGCDRIAQLGNAEIQRVERLARVERCRRGVTNVRRRDLVGLAEPEGQDIGFSHPALATSRISRRDEGAHGGAPRDRCGPVRGSFMYRWRGIMRDHLYTGRSELANQGARMRVYGIVNCNTVKAARAWLESQRQSYEFVDFKKAPPTRDQLAGWCKAFGWERVLNRRGMTWRMLPPAVQERVKDENSAIALMLEKPSAIKRPVSRIRVRELPASTKRTTQDCRDKLDRPIRIIPARSFRSTRVRSPARASTRGLPARHDRRRRHLRAPCGPRPRSDYDGAVRSGPLDN